MVARCGFESSFRFRSAVLFGTFERIGDEDKVGYLDQLADNLHPGPGCRASPARARNWPRPWRCACRSGTTTGRRRSAAAGPEDPTRTSPPGMGRRGAVDDGLRRSGSARRTVTPPSRCRHRCVPCAGRWSTGGPAEGRRSPGDGQGHQPVRQRMESGAHGGHVGAQLHMGNRGINCEKTVFSSIARQCGADAVAQAVAEATWAAPVRARSIRYGSGKAAGSGWPIRGSSRTRSSGLIVTRRRRRCPPRAYRERRSCPASRRAGVPPRPWESGPARPRAPATARDG